MHIGTLIQKMNHKYKIGAKVILRHAGSYATGIVTKHTTFTPNRVNAKPIYTYTVKGNNGFIYPLLGVDGTMSAGNILSKDTKAGHILESDMYDDEIPEADNRVVYNTYNIGTLQDLCKERKLPYYGTKKILINRLLVSDKKK